MHKNKIKLNPLNEPNSAALKPPSRPPVFERLTSGLGKNTRNRSKKETNTKKLEEVKIMNNIKKVHPMGRFGDTGSSSDKEYTKVETIEKDESYGPTNNRLIKEPHFSKHQYDISSSIPSLKTKFHINKSGSENHAFDNSRFNLRNSSLQKLNEKADVIERYEIKTQVGKNSNKEKKVNQDSYICQKNDKYWMFGVLDGHGIYGHHASALVKKLLPKNIFKKK